MAGRISMANPNHNDNMNDFQTRQNEVAALPLDNRDRGEDWGEISHLNGKPCSKQQANEFLPCCLLDWQMKADVAWANGYRLVEDILGNPEDLWRAITSVSESAWESKRSEYKLHRFPAGHNRLWKIAKRISISTMATPGASGKGGMLEPCSKAFGRWTRDPRYLA
jgi:hypothetical protein